MAEVPTCRRMLGPLILTNRHPLHRLIAVIASIWIAALFILQVLPVPCRAPVNVAIVLGMSQNQTRSANKGSCCCAKCYCKASDCLAGRCCMRACANCGLQPRIPEAALAAPYSWIVAGQPPVNRWPALFDSDSYVRSPYDTRLAGIAPTPLRLPPRLV